VTPHRKTVLDKLTVTHLVKKFLSLCGTRKFITVFAAVCFTTKFSTIETGNDEWMSAENVLCF